MHQAYSSQSTKANLHRAVENEKAPPEDGAFQIAYRTSAVLLVLLTTLVAALLLLAGLLLPAALLATLLLATSLLLAGLLVWILIHFTFLSNIGLSAISIGCAHNNNARPLCLFRATSAFNFEEKRIWNLIPPRRVPFQIGGTDDGTLPTAVVAWDTDSYTGADLDIRRLALAPQRRVRATRRIRHSLGPRLRGPKPYGRPARPPCQLHLITLGWRGVAAPSMPC
jgi:hypothetical protein